MNMAQVKRLREGDTFRRPSANGHDVSGFRRFEVSAVDARGVQVMDEHGYGSILPYAGSSTRDWFKLAEPVKIQQGDKPESVVRAEVLAFVPQAQYLNLTQTDGGHAVDDPCGDRYLSIGAPSRRAAWRQALRFLKRSKQ